MSDKEAFAIADSYRDAANAIRNLMVGFDGSDFVILKVNSDGSLSIVVDIGVESAFSHGQNTAIGTSATQLIVASTTAERGVTVKALNTNTNAIFIGGAAVTTAVAAR